MEEQKTKGRSERERENNYSFKPFLEDRWLSWDKTENQVMVDT